MTDDEFWKLIDESRARADGSEDQQAVELVNLLRERSRADLKAFYRRYHALHRHLNSYDVWGAGYVLDDGMSDDGFYYFRDWLISRGRDVYDIARTDPDALAEIPGITNGSHSAERLGGAVFNAYEQNFGVELLKDAPDEGEMPEERAFRFQAPVDPSGERFDDDDLPTRYPRLTALVAGAS